MALSLIRKNLIVPFQLYIIIGFCLIQDWDRQNPTQIVTEICGFVTILSGTFLLHKTKDAVDGVFSLFFVDILSNSLLVPRWNQRYLNDAPFAGSSASIQMRMSKHSDENAYDPEGMPLRRQDNMRPS